ncbi:hypothetical protein PCANB_002655 [Pneumocystis canis]|nr:hypothetical protein PCANB_002655 [Pneumocystis canis]
MKIALVHPDLGIGGAERFIVDVAIGLQKQGHEIVIYTSYCDKKHCFEEVKKGLVDVRIYGDKIPSKIFGKFSILCSIFRQFYLSISVLFEKRVYDVIIVDILSFSIPLLRWKCLKLLFYCHFPDKLLANHNTLLRKIYRLPFDWIEGLTLSMADKILVNSYFTASIVEKTFPHIKNLTVLYPSIDIYEENFLDDSVLICNNYRHLFVSINRFERKKDISLAIKSYYHLKNEDCFNQCYLIIAGGYESRIQENVQYHNELVDLCDHLMLKSKTFQYPYEFPLDFSGYNIVFLLSIPAKLKNYLLKKASVLLYTPPYEHFGIVPLEAMLHRTIVLAQNNGGPLETIDDGVTGWLRESNDMEWARILRKILFEFTDTKRIAMGEKGRQKVIRYFSRESMIQTLQCHIEKTNREIILKSNKLNNKKEDQGNSVSKPLFSRSRTSLSFLGGKNEFKMINRVNSREFSPNHVFHHSPLFDERYDEVFGDIYQEDDSFIQKMIDRYGTINFIRQLVRGLALRNTQVIENQKLSKDREIILKKMLLNVGVSHLDIEKYLHESYGKSQESSSINNSNHVVSGLSYFESLDEKFMQTIRDDNMHKCMKINLDSDGKVSNSVKTTEHLSLQKNMNLNNQKKIIYVSQNHLNGKKLKTINGKNIDNLSPSICHEFHPKKDFVSNFKTFHIHSKLQSYSRSLNKIIPRMTSFDSSFEAFSKISGFGSYFKENVSNLRYFHTLHFKAIALSACCVLLFKNFDKEFICQKGKSSMIIDFAWRLILPLVLDYHQFLIQDYVSKSKSKVSNLNLDTILSKYFKELSDDNFDSKIFSVNCLYEKIIKLKLKKNHLYKNFLLNDSILSNAYSQNQHISQPDQTDTNFPSVIKEMSASVLASKFWSFLSSYSAPRPLEMDTIVPPECQPPTLLPSWNEYYRVDEKPLVDRFGFIYTFGSKKKSFDSKLIQSTKINNNCRSQFEDIDYSSDVDFVKDKPDEEIELMSVSYLKKDSCVTSTNSSQKFIDVENKLLGHNGIPLTTLTSLSSDSSIAQGFITVNLNKKSKGFATKFLLRSHLDTSKDDKAKQELWDIFLQKIQNEKKSSIDPDIYGYEDSDLIGIPGLGIAGKVGKQRWKKFRNLVIGGIPMIWKECSGAYQLQQPGYYTDLLTMGKDIDPMVVAQIDMDIYRTMPNNVFFGKKGPGVFKLKNVLLAFSRHNIQIGYCQGMNVIAATLLLTHATEEDAFYVLVSIVENILPPHYFTPDLLASRADQRVLIRYVAELCPRVYAHLKKLSVDLEAVTFNWFLSVFTDCLPAEVLFRVFDLLFIEGNVYLFRVSIAIIKSREKQILECTSPSSVYSLLKNLSIESFNIDSFIQATCENKKQIRIKDAMHFREIEIRKLKAEMGNTVL